MGFLGRLFGTDPEAKLEKARRLNAMSEFHEARWLLEGLDHPGTAAAMADTMAGLIAVNLEEARALYSAGDRERGEEHLTMAREFGANADQLRQARRQGREAMPAPKSKKAPVETGPVGDDPIWSLPPDDPRLRYALMVETYPEQLRARLLGLGPDFAEAALRTDTGDAVGAMGALSSFVGIDDVARYERARAAIAAGELPAAASELIQFGESLGHQTIGANHTAMMMVQALSQLGRAEEALERIIRALDATDNPREQIMMQNAEAQLLFLLGRDEEADTKATALLRNASRDMGLVKLLSRIRKRRGQRINAMAMLEDGLNRCCSAPGKCGSQPLDLEAVRMLLIMYLEDRIEPARVSALLADLEKHRKQAVWDDGYIAALQSRNASDPSLGRQLSSLVNGLGPTNPRRRILSAAFPDQMTEA
jgi:tetratricopeptide (TPR) repeat protein